MKISAIVPAYNAEKYLKRGVESLLATHYPDLEIMIVDDGSTDSTWEIALSLQQDSANPVVACRHPDGRNHGVSAARNLGIQRSSGELICFLDADDYVLPHRFRTSVPLLAHDMTIDGVYELTRMEFEGQPDGNAFWNEDGSFGITERLESEALLQSLLKGTIWHINAILFRRSLLDRTGVFREDMRFAEDCHLWFRMACVGRIVGGDLSDPVSVYCRHENNAFQYTLERRVDMVRAMTDVYSWAKKKHLNKTTMRTLFEGVRDFVLNGIIVARENDETALARRILAIPLRAHCFGLVANRPAIRQLLALCRESLVD
jgi:glycosyltransferase involved in cell wall biosynthesis